MTKKSPWSMALLVMVLSFSAAACGDRETTQIVKIKSPTAPSTPTPTPPPAVSSVDAYITNKYVDLGNCEAVITFGVKILPDSAPQNVDDWELITLSGSGTLTKSGNTATLRTKGGKFKVKAIVAGVSGFSEAIEVKGCGVIVTPGQPEPSVDLKVNGKDGPVTVAKGTVVDVDRYLTNCVSATWISGPLTGMVGGNGRDRVKIDVDTRFGMRCTAASGEKDEDFVQVNVSSTTPPPTTPAPVCPIRADHLSIPQGGSTVIRYTSTNATTVIGLSGFSGSLPLSDDRAVILGETTTFTIQCSGPGGTSPPQSVTVTVTPPACPTSIDYSPKGDSVNVNGSKALTVDNWPSNVSCDPFWHLNDSSRARIRGTKTCLVDDKPFYCGPAATLEGVYPTTSVKVTVQIAIPLPRPEKSYFWSVVANTLTEMLRLDLSFMSNGRDEHGVCQTLACK